MFSLLLPVSWASCALAFLFATLSLASGLLYIAELIEENSRFAKLAGQRAIYAVITLHVLFYFSDSFPLHLVAFGIVCHLVYLQNFSKTWPFISLTSIRFIASCLLVILDHFAWFFYFAERAKETSGLSRHPRQPGYRPGNNSWDARYGNSGRGHSALRELSFMEVSTFFGVCVWLVPFFLFLSLSANDNVLPSLGEQTPQIKTTSASEAGSPNPGSTLRIQPVPRERSSILKVALDPLLSLIPRIGGGKNRSSRSQRDGLIASPIASAPPSPSMYGQPPSPLYGGQTMPYSPNMNGYSTGAATLSPQTPFNNRFADAAIRNAQSSPQLRQPPVTKRSATSPPGDLLHQARFPPGNPYVQPTMLGGDVPNTPPPPARSASPYQQQQQQSPPRMDEQELSVGQAIPRSTSPFAPTGAAGGSGLVARKKHAA